MERSEANERLFEDISRIAGRINMAVEATHRPSSSDICFSPPQVPKIDGMGPLGDGIRTDDEYILRHSLTDRAALLAHVILFCATGSEP